MSHWAAKALTWNASGEPPICLACARIALQQALIFTWLALLAPPPTHFLAPPDASASGPPSSVSGASSVTSGVLAGGGTTPASSTAGAAFFEHAVERTARLADAQRTRTARDAKRIG